MILLIDNYDSFSYNLFQLVGSISPDIRVVRNDEMSIEEIRELAPKGIILSPGPGRPEDAGICIDVVKELAGEIPILGVCLGEQSICTAYGAVVSYAKQLMHGKQSLSSLDTDSPIFAGCPNSAMVGRYHSLAVREETLPDNLKVIARTNDGEVMAVSDEEKQVYGLQFHPESILTPDGRTMLMNYMKLCKEV
ncbi:MAG: aminodeoxychorismate/anthranilate synthase component II [Lachnospiraceae bacterium]|nr:aminodeoxychorismate/anthranilate synthase component II [Lachnospiraceae bacterium]